MMAFLQSMKLWLRSSNFGMFEWISEKTEVLQDENESLEPLPSEMMESLQQNLNALPNHPEDWQSLQATLEKAICQWQADPLNNENGIAVLSSPVDTIARLLCSDLLAELDVEIHPPSFCNGPNVQRPQTALST